MPEDSIPRSIALLLLILGGGFFASAETAFSYCNRIRMKTLAEDGDRKAHCVMKVLDRFDDTIIAVLIGNNVIHVVASLLATLLAIDLLPFSEGIASLIASVVLTILVFIFSETIPKTIAKDNADSMAKLYAFPVWIFSTVLIPLEIFFSFFTKLARVIVKLFSGVGTEEPSITEDEFTDMVETVEESGSLEPEESEIIKSAIEFRDMLTSDVMVPIEQVTMLDINAPYSEVYRVLSQSRFSRIPIYRGSIENVIGLVQVKKCLWRVIHDQSFRLEEMLTGTYVTTPEKPLVELFEDLARNKAMMAFVIDSFGKTKGIITLEDILEEIVGEIYDEDDPEGDTPERKEAAL